MNQTMISAQKKLPATVWAVWWLVEDGTRTAAFVGDRRFWRWPWPNLRGLARFYGYLGLLLVLPLSFLTLITAATTTLGVDGQWHTGYSGLHLSVGFGLLALYVGTPLILALQRPYRWEARVGHLNLNGEDVVVQSGVGFHLIKFRYTTRHGYSGYVRRESRTRDLLRVEWQTPDGVSKILATFDFVASDEVYRAVRRLAQVAGVGCVETDATFSK